MAWASELVTVIAEATGLEHGTLTRYARIAREGGFLSQSGRGTSAARMRPTDAANLLSCVLVNGVAQEAPAQIRRVQDMDVYHRDADHLDDRHLSREDQDRLRDILHIAFDRRHTLSELLIALVERATDDWQGFEEHFGNSFIHFLCDDYEAEVHFDILLDRDAVPFGPNANFSFSYSHPLLGVRSPHFRRSTQLFFKCITRIGKLLSAK